MTEEQFTSAKEVARQLGTDARTLRKFLRSEHSPFEAVGQGGRYNFDADDITVLKEAFHAQLLRKRTPQKPKVIEVPEDDGEGSEETDFDLDFSDGIEELDDDIEEI